MSEGIRRVLADDVRRGDVIVGGTTHRGKVEDKVRMDDIVSLLLPDGWIAFRHDWPVEVTS